MGLTGLFNFKSIANMLRARSKGVEGNTSGEGRLLGGLIVVDPKNGVIFQYAEKVFGDHANLDDVKNAILGNKR